MSGFPKKKDRIRKRATLEQLEARTLYSADPISAGVAAVGMAAHDVGFNDNHLYPESSFTDEAITTATDSRQVALEIVFIDESTPDRDLLIADLLTNTSAERTFKVITIASHQDGIQVISDTLAEYTEVSAVHLLSHGSDGSVNIGNTVLNQSTLPTHENTISNWGNAFTSDGDLLIYGCEFSATDSGKALGAKIAALAQVDVASSDNRTGGSEVSGDWVLEEIVGTIETALPFSDQLQDTYQRSLANTITVSTTADIIDGNPTTFDSLISSPGADGEVSLREAIIAANTQAGADTIVLPSGTYQLTIGGYYSSDHFTGDHNITSEITITGASPSSTSISGLSSGDRVIEVASGGSLTLSNITIEEGKDKQGSGIRNDGNLTTNNVTFTNNDAATFPGGAIANYGTAIITDTTFDSNHANRGGAFTNHGTLTVVNSTFANNTGSSSGGGAIYNQAGDTTISQSSFINNSGNNGGAVAITDGSVTITNSTLSGNSSTGIGGAVYTHGGDAIIRYSTVSENTAAGHGGGVHSQSGSITIGSSIFANNIGSLGATWGTQDAGNITVSEGNNIILSTKAGSTTPVASDQFGVDPLLLPFDNATNTYPLDAASPAINNGGSTPISADQLGILRDTSPDVGAVEYVIPIPTGPNEAPSIDFIEDSVFINEIHYDNTGADIDESIEIAGPAGTDLSGWTLELYSGSTPYDTINLTGIIPDEGNNVGAINFPTPGSLKNGPNDAIALIDTTGAVVEFLSYEGVLTATTGAAAGMTSLDIGVSQSGSEQIGYSLQRTDFISPFAWATPSPNTLGTINSTQAGLTLATQVTEEDNPLVFSTINGNPITVTDEDPNANLQLTLSVSSGTLAFSSTPSSQNNTLSYTGSQAEINAELENLLYTPDTDYHGNDILTVMIEDQHANGSLSSTKVIDIIVKPTNDAPSGKDKILQTDEDTPITIQSTDFGFSDTAEGHAFAAVTITTVPTNGTLTWNGANVSAGQLISITDINNGGLEFSPAPNENGNAYTDFGFQVHDNGGIANGGIDQDPTTNKITFDVLSINDAPSGADATLSTNSNTPIIFSSADFGFSDADGDSFVAINTLYFGSSITLAGNPIGLTDVISIADINNGDLVYTPTSITPGMVSIETLNFHVVDDGGTTNGGSDTALLYDRLTIEVSYTSSAPTGTDKLVAANEDVAVTIVASDFGFSDTDQDTLTAVTITGLPTDGMLTLAGVPVTVNQTISAADITLGNLVFTPVADQYGTPYTSFDFQVQDSGSTANGGQILDQSSNTLTFAYSSVSDAPSANDNTLVTNANTPLTLTPLDFGFSDLQDGDNFTSVTITSLPLQGSLLYANIPVALNQVITVPALNVGALIYAPALNQSGMAYDNFNFRVNDDGNTNLGGVNQSQQDNTISFDVLHVNSAPSGSDTTLTTNEDSTIVIQSSDFGFSDPINADFFAAVTITRLPNNGILELANSPVTTGQLISIVSINNGDLSFTPNPNDSATGYADFDFQVHDNGGTTNGGNDQDQTANTMTFDVVSINDAPRGTDTTIDILEGAPYTINTADLGYSDILDGDALLAVEFSAPTNGILTLYANPLIISGATGLTITANDLNNGKLVYTPAPDAAGQAYDSLSFRVFDNGGIVNGGDNFDPTWRTLTFNIDNVNDAPAGADKSLSTNEDSPITIQSTDFGFSDAVEGDAFAAVTITTLPTNGTLTLAGSTVTAGQLISITKINNNELVFTPSLNDNGTAYTNFDFQVHDNGGTANGGIDQDQTPNKITLDVLSVNDPPSGTNNTVAIIEDTPYTLAVGDFGFSDPADGNAFIGAFVAPPSSGTLTLSGNPVTTYSLISAFDINLGNLVYTPTPNANGIGADSFIFQVVDNGGTSNSGASIQPSVSQLQFDIAAKNDEPAGTDHTITTNEDTSVILKSSDFGFSDIIDSDAFAAVTLTTLPAQGTLTLAGNPVSAGQLISITGINNSDLVFTPALGDHGNSYADFDFQVHDNGGTSNGGIDQDATANTITFNVGSVNNAPSGTNNSVTTLEDQPVTFQSTDFGFSDAIDGDAFAALTITALPVDGALTLSNTPVSAGQLISITDINNGNLAFTPAPDDNGSPYTEFGFQVHDDGGTANGGIDQDQTINKITLNVLSVNDKPSGSFGVFDTDENTPIVFSAADFGFTDPADGNNFTGVELPAVTTTELTLAGAPVVSGQLISITDINNGNFVYTPTNTSAENSPLLTFFNVHDDGGNANGGVSRASFSSIIMINVANVNEAPSGTDRILTTNEDTAITLQGSDFGFSDPVDGDAFAAVTVVSPPTKGTLTLSGNNVSAGQLISITDISNGNLRFTPAPNENGNTYADFGFQVHDNGGTTDGGIDQDQTSNFITFKVTAVNDSPQGIANTVSTTEDTPLTLSLADFTYSDTDSNPLAAVTVAPPANGTLTLAGVAINQLQTVTASEIDNGDLVFSPAPDTSGTNYTTVAFNVRDNGGTLNGGSDTDQQPELLTIDVLALNDAPSAADSTITSKEDIPIILSAPNFGFTDSMDQDSLQEVLISSVAGNGTLTVNGSVITAPATVSATDINNGLVTYTPAPDTNGTGIATIDFRVKDDGGTINGGQDTSIGTNVITINIDPVNDAPQGSDATYTLLEDASRVLTLADFGYSDPTENQAFNTALVSTAPVAGQLTLAGIPLVAGDVISLTALNNGDVLYAPAAGESGTAYDSFGFQVQDDGGTANGGIDTDQTPAKITFTITPVSDAPSGRDKLISINEDSNYSLSLSDFGFTDSAEETPDQFQSVTITQLPVTGTLFNNGIALTVSESVSATDITSGNFTYTPSANAFGQAFDNFSFRVTDSGNIANGGENQDQSDNQILFDISSVSDAPSGTDSTTTINEDEPYTLTTSNFGFSDSIDGDLFSAITIVDTPTQGILTLAGNVVAADQPIGITEIVSGNLVYTPAPDANGTTPDNFTFLVHDTGSTANGGQKISQTANTAMFNVLPVNDAPVGINKSATVSDNTAYLLDATDFAFTDTENHALQSVRIDSIPGNGLLSLFGAPVSAGDSIAAVSMVPGALVYQPAVNLATQEVIQFTVTDNGGTANNGTDTQATPAQLTLTTLIVNDPPSATDKTVTINEDNTYTLSIADFGFSDPAEQHNFLELAIGSTSGDGSLALDGVPITTATTVSAFDLDAGLLTFTPTSNTSGIGYATVNYQVRDDGGTTNGGQDTSLQQTVTFDVIAVNDAPSGQNGTMVTFEDTPVPIKPLDLGFIDIDNNELLAVQISSTPSSGSLQLAGQTVFPGDVIPAIDLAQGNLVYLPAPNATGGSSFSFVVKDDGGTANGGRDTELTPNILTVSMIPVNDAPEGINGSASIGEDQSYEFSFADFPFSDPADGHSLQEVVITSTPTSGQLTNNGTLLTSGDSVSAIDITAGNLTYTPAAQTSGTQQLGFQVRDSGGTNNGGTDLDPTVNTFDISTNAVNDAPSAQSTAFTIRESAQHIFAVADFGFSDSADGDTLQNIIFDQVPANGALFINGTTAVAGQTANIADIASDNVIYEPIPGQWGQAYDSLQFRVQDSGGTANGGVDTSTQAETISFNVAEVNSAPSGSDKNININEKLAYTLSASDFGFSDTADYHNFSSVRISSLSSGGVLQNSGAAVLPGDEISITDISAGQVTYQTIITNGNYEIGFQVSDDGNPQNGETTDQTANLITFDLTLVNDPPTLTNTGATYDEGSDNVVSTTVLAAVDPDDPAQDLIFTLSNTPSNGDLTVAGEMLTAGDTFTMQQLNSNELHYIHDGSETSRDHFDFSVVDGGEDGVLPIDARFNIDINEVVDLIPDLDDDSLTISYGESFDSALGDILNSGEASLLDPEELSPNAASPNTLDDQFAITIIQQPEHGTVTLNPDGTFLYAHAGENYDDDSFIYRITNSDGASALATINITVEPVIGNAIEEIQNQFPVAIAPQVITEAPSEAEVITETVSEPEPEPVVEVAPETVEESQAITDPESIDTGPLNEELAFSATSLSSNMLIENEISTLGGVHYNEFEIENSALTVERDLLRSLDVTQHDEPDGIYLFESDSNTRVSLSAINLQIATPLSVSNAVSNNDFLRGLSQAQGDLETAQFENRTRFELGNDVAISVSISTTAGILAWVLRGGALFGSLMAATPLWSSIDPLRITESRKGENDTEQSEVEKIFD